MFYYDAHCHLLPIKSFQKAKELGVKYFIVNATHPDNWEGVCRLAQEEKGVFGCVGVHPWFVDNLPRDWYERLEDLLRNNPLLMIGEIGLDGTRDNLTYQAEVFEKCLKLARLYKRPAHVHGVKAWSSLVDILSCYADVPCLLHRYAGSEAHTRQLLKYNAYFSFIRGKAFESVPPDRVMVESDSPDGLHTMENVIELVKDSGVPHSQLNDNFFKFISNLNGSDKVVDELKNNHKKLLERTRLMFSEMQMQSLRQAHVLVAGCGAVGSMAAEALARTGIGHITVVDFDFYQESNLNRQIFATMQTLNMPKTQAAKERLLSIAPDIKVTTKNVLINAQTVDDLFNEKIDFVIDAIDSLNPKTILIETLQKKHIPFISAMGAAMKTDLSLISVGSMKKTIECPLAAFVRKRLRRRGVDLNFPVVWSRECVSDKAHLGEKESNEPNARHIMGSLMTVTGIFGLISAHEALLFLTNDEKSFFHGRI